MCGGLLETLIEPEYSNGKVYKIVAGLRKLRLAVFCHLPVGPHHAFIELASDPVSITPTPRPL